MATRLAVFAVLCFTFVHAQDNMDGMQKMSFETPNMNEEEQHSMHTPSSYEIQCDACTAISYQMNKALHKEENKRPSLKGKPVPESVYVDAIEQVCSSKTWDDYGVKPVNKINRLSGEGLEAKDVPGMMAGGGKWPGRLSSKCESMVGDIGEDTLYEKFREDGDLHRYLCTEFTKDCVKDKTNSKKKGKKSKGKKKDSSKEEL